MLKTRVLRFKFRFRVILPALFCAGFLFFPALLSFPQDSDLKALHTEIAEAVQKLGIQSQNDTMRILPRIEHAFEEEKKGHTALAHELLESCRFDLNLIESQRAFDSPQFWPRQAWLEIVFDLLRNYVLIAILALISVKFYFPRKKEISEIILSKWSTALWLTAAGFLFGTYDVMRSGSAASSYFDLQLVFSACAGFAGGFLPGLVCGFLFAVLRLILQPASWGIAVVLTGAGFLGAVFFYISRRFGKTAALSAGAGICAGSLHAIAVFLGPDWPREYAMPAAGGIGAAEAGGVFLFTAVALALLRGEKQKADERELLQSRLLLLQTQIKPHFLFNALNTIAAVSSKEAASQTRGLIEKLADFFRLSLQYGRDEIGLSEEMEFVSSYLDLEKARFGESLQIKKSFQWTERARNTKVPALLIQPLVENAIRYGARKKSETGTVCVDIIETERHVNICVRDDGPGIPPEKLAALQRGEPVQGEGLGIGLGNIQKRLKQYFGKNAVMVFESSEKGASVTLQLPLKGN